nr:MAG TPA: Protein of unknown function (DUF3641) [Caudoviricetes sp.]
MTIYELIQELVSYPPETEIVFDYNGNLYDCDFTYKKYLNELHIEPD